MYNDDRITVEPVYSTSAFERFASKEVKIRTCNTRQWLKEIKELSVKRGYYINKYRFPNLYNYFYDDFEIQLDNIDWLRKIAHEYTSLDYVIAKDGLYIIDCALVTPDETTFYMRQINI